LKTREGGGSKYRDFISAEGWGETLLAALPRLAFRRDDAAIGAAFMRFL
jgi:hypothetical protein